MKDEIMNTDNFHYLANKSHRDAVMRQANRQRLISIATHRTASRAFTTRLLVLLQAFFVK
jgi:hypothetical protein